MKNGKKLSLFTFWNTEIFQWVIRLCRLFFCAYDSVCFVCTVHCIYHFHFVTYVNFLKVNFAYCKKTKKSHWPWSVSSINPRQRTRTTPIHGPIYDVTTFKIKSTDRSLDKPNDKGVFVDTEHMWPFYYSLQNHTVNRVNFAINSYVQCMYLLDLQIYTIFMMVKMWYKIHILLVNGLHLSLFC